MVVENEEDYKKKKRGEGVLLCKEEGECCEMWKEGNNQREGGT